MEDELFALVYLLLEQEGNKRSRRGRTQYSDVLILAVYFWAVVHDRPTCWACKRCHWPAAWQWLSLPSQPTMSRRLRSFSVVQLLMALMDRLRQIHEPQIPADPLVHVIDSRPLVVGGFSKDRQSRWGYATGGKARGYKESSRSVCGCQIARPERGREGRKKTRPPYIRGVWAGFGFGR